MKKTLALVLAFAMMFSTITVAFAEGEVSAEAKALATVGMLEGDGEGVTVEYTAKEMTRLTAAISLLKLKGLYADALVFVGDANFADVDTVLWAEGKNILAYMKANPGLGFIGNEKGEFDPSGNVNEQSYYKVLLETLGYKQSTAEVVGDFAWADVLTFATSVGLAPVNVTPFTVDALAKATVEALNVEMKDGGTLINALVDGGKVDMNKAIAAGLYVEASLTAVLDSATAIGNTVVEVVFEEDVDAAALENAEYAIEGLEVKEAVVAGSDTVRLTTAAMTAGKLYTLTVGEEKVKFAGIGKISGAPAIDLVESKDVEEVKVDFSKVMDFETATDVANYTIVGVEVISAEVDGDVVTLTTNGVVAKKQYTLKVTNVKSIDGALLKSASKSFYSRPDVAAPTVSSVTAETNERVVIVFNEEVTKDSAEDVANYTIKTGTTELAIEKAELVEDDDDLWTTVELTTEAQKANARYSIVIENIADDTNATNTMKKAVTKYFYGKKADETAPVLNTKPVAISKNNILVAFKDASDFDESSVLDPNNYELAKGSTDYTVESATKVYFSSANVYMVNLVVEDLELGSYSLKMTDISDEFGNIMDDKKSSFTVTRDSYASAKVTAYKVTDKNKMVLTFDKPLVKAAAIDLANYTFNEELGSPVKLAYSTSSYKVTVTTNDFVLNKQYKLTVAGVEDIAGNVLDFNFKFYASYGAADAPELESAYSVNKYVVALAFDEEIETFAGAKLTLKDTATVNPAPDVVLDANALTEDDTVVEFSKYPTVSLREDVTYFVSGITSGIVGPGGKVFVAPADLNDYLVYGTDETPERAEVLNAEQVNGVAFDITMSKYLKEIKAADGIEIVAKKGLNNVTFDVVTDEDVITLTIATGKIDEDAEYVVDLSALLTDEHLIPVLDQDEEDGGTNVKTTLYAEYVDEDKPYIVNVVAIDRYNVEIEYSEEMGKAAAYKVVNADEDIKTLYNITNVDKDDEFITLTLATALQGRYDYKLIIVTGNGEDLAGNTDEEEAKDEFYFNGTDLSPVGTPTDINAEEAAAAAAALAAAVEAAEDAQAAYTTAGGLTTDLVYAAVTTALAADPQVTADIVAATEALEEATTALEAAAALAAAVEAAEDAQAAYTIAGGLTTDLVYAAVTTALAADPQVTADIVAATAALVAATDAL